MGTAINLDEIKRFEVTEVYSHPDAKVDIVLVHGLNGDPRRTWTATGNSTFWPTQLLPVSLKSAQARILVYGYNADVYTFGNSKAASSDMIHHHAQTLIANLALERKSEEVEEHPIIFVAHSLGGILVKRALELSNDLQSKNADDNRSIFVSTYGIVFLGTPHNGADPAKWGLILQGMVSALVPKKILHSESQLVKTLQSNNETLQNINLHFLDIYQKFKICMVHEAAPTDLKGTKTFIVDKESAAPLLPDVQYFGIEATHSGMCKFESKNAPGYMNVSMTIRGWVQECGPVIQARWENEKRQRWQSKQAQAAELLGTYQLSPQGSTHVNTPDPSNSMNNSTIMVKSTLSIEPEESLRSEDAPYFIKPSGFRPNSLFVGRAVELAELHKMLFDDKRRAEGTSAVLIQSMPGGGKTHLARQYVYEYKEHYPGGIFWLRAKSTTELAAGFWDIARRATLKHLTDPAEIEDMKQDSEQFVRSVKKWLNRRRDWLVVLDGIHFNDAKELQKFIPDSPQTGLIYTSTERSVSGNHLFMNPQMIRLPRLSAREAQTLLLLELDRKEPFTTDDLKHSMDLVQAMEFLPVVIHAVAQRLKSTGEPLSKFARNYSHEPKLRGLGTYIAVVEQLKLLGAYETLNLIYILCFFSQHIPVEMIVLGLKALDSPYHIPVKASEPISGKSLNNTFKVLNTFALIDRNEHEASMHSSQSSKGSRDMLADNVDVIRLHAVVQGFFVDTLSGNGSLPVWLDHAVRLFCCSYDKANERITRKSNAGLVEDYRLYEIHGIKLREHLSKQLSKHLKSDERIMLEAGRITLEERLQSIKSEIERRTPESSHVIAGGKPEVFQTSIFDRTSSSSDTGPDTPGVHDRNHSRVSTWGFEPGMAQQESPARLTHDSAFTREQLEEIYRVNFPMPMPEDIGYESDRESSTAMTVQPSQRTIHGNSPQTFGEEWQTVVNRRQASKPVRLEETPLHRSIKNMERQRYRDSAGAYRSLGAVDPRVTRETVTGFLQNTTGVRERSRGRLSGQSSAEVALAQISKNSPPPTRGGGMIQDRRSRSNSHLGNEGRRMMTGLSSYAAAVAGSTKDTILGWKEDSRPSSSSDATSPTERPPITAKESLQRIPVELITGSSPRATTGTSSHVLPYPLTPTKQPPSGRAGTYPFPEQYGQENNRLGPNPYPSYIYPRMEGGPFVETIHSDVASASSSFRPPTLISQSQSEYRSSAEPSSLYPSLSSPNITLHRDNSHGLAYYPGRPELSSQAGGYTSQPMSRDPSGQSNNPLDATDGDVREGKRRTSLAETEPLPALPGFSPKIPPTSYQVYEQMRQSALAEESGGRSGEESPRLTREEWEREALVGLTLAGPYRGEGGMSEGKRKKSPHLGYARAALIDRLEEWNSAPGSVLPTGDEARLRTTARSPSLRNFNPTAPSFSPSPSTASAPASTYPHYSPSHAFPPVPPNSAFTSYPTSITNTPPPLPYPVSAIPPSATTHSSPIPSPRLRNANITASSSPGPVAAIVSETEMGRSRSGSGSGGVRLPGGNKIIEFGDFPEKVDADAARERVLRSWREKEKRERDREIRERERDLVVTSPDAIEDTDLSVGLGVDLGR